MCGFANFASIGIQIGGIGSLAPGQRKTLSEFGMKALIGGSIASLMSATIAGMIIGSIVFLKIVNNLFILRLTMFKAFLCLIH